MQDVQNL